MNGALLRSGQDSGRWGLWIAGHVRAAPNRTSSHRPVLDTRSVGPPLLLDRRGQQTLCLDAGPSTKASDASTPPQEDTIISLEVGESHLDDDAGTEDPLSHALEPQAHSDGEAAPSTGIPPSPLDLEFLTDSESSDGELPVPHGSKLTPQSSSMSDRPAMLSASMSPATSKPASVSVTTPTAPLAPPPDTSHDPRPPEATPQPTPSPMAPPVPPPPSTHRASAPPRAAATANTAMTHSRTPMQRTPQPLPASSLPAPPAAPPPARSPLPSPSAPSSLASVPASMTSVPSNMTPLHQLPPMPSALAPGLQGGATMPPPPALNPANDTASAAPGAAGTRPAEAPAGAGGAAQSAPGTGADAGPDGEWDGRLKDEDSLPMVHPFHLAIFAILLSGGMVFATLVTNFTTDMGFMWSAMQVARKLAKSLAFRQSLALMVAIAFVRYGLEPLVKSVRNVFSLPGPWERSNEHFILQQVYRPLEFLLFIAAISTVVEAVLPPLMAISKDTVRQVVRTMLSLTYVIASARVVFNIKARFVQERTWQAELIGDVSSQRRIEATDKLVSLLVLFVAGLLGLQAAGLDINSVLAISGFGGLALGLAGREILENLFNGLLIISNRSFEVGEEILFTQSGMAGRVIEGIVLDIGWYRTLIRSFEREVYVIPNSVFSRTVVLNVTRKGKEWRFYEMIGIRVQDVDAVHAIVADMRRIIRQDPRVLQKLHRRVFLDKLHRDQLSIYISFYIDAANRDAFMAAKQDMFMSFAGCCRRHGASLATNRLEVEVQEGDTRLEQMALPELGAALEMGGTPSTGLTPFDPNNPFPNGPPGARPN